MASAYVYSDLHELIDRLEPEQAEEVRRHALRLLKPAPSRFRILRSFDGPSTDLGPGRRRSSGRRSARTMLIVDSGPLVVFLNRNDPDHEWWANLLKSYDGDLLVTP
ncbi:hypothetical protein [Streptomyces bluensis]|uniref:DUF385 domain-containing protein n=1 Tax=Streptomyces bluensis TaxID=33897 RepID=A0ABW6UCZ6_9ACTN